MRAIFSLLALALVSIAIATGDHHSTTYVTVTTCPITSTKYEHGTTKVVTELTTSTITVTACVGCEGVTTVPGPTRKEYTTTLVEYTYTTTCPVTETITAPGHTETKTYTTTSVITEKVLTTLYNTVKSPDETTKVTEGVTVTTTSLYPITQTKTIGGGIVTVTYTSTSVYETVIPTYIKEYTTLAPHTTEQVTWVYSISTSYCPITTVKTVSGTEVTVVYTSTSLIVEKIPTTIYKTETVLTTYYLTSVVHQTIKTIETNYVTVKAGSTITLATTLFSTLFLTDEFTVTKTLEPPTTKATLYQPITLETSVPVTEYVTVPSELTVTSPGPTFIATVPITTRVTSTSGPATTSAPLQVSQGAAPTSGPVAYAIVGGMALVAALI